MFGRIIKKGKNSTTIFSKGSKIKFNFASKHSIGDLIDKNDNLISKCNNPQMLNKAIESYYYYTKKFEFIKKIKEFFLEQGFTETITPKLKNSRLNETNINTIITPVGILAPSPEVELKKLLCLGFDKIFELNWAYRDDYENNLHKKEFLMLEWYRALNPPETIIEDFKQLTKHLCKCDKLSYKNYEIDLNKINYISYKNLFLRFVGIDITKTQTKELKKEFSIEGTDDYSEILDAIFSLKIEKKLGRSSITVIYDFPYQKAALAKIENGWAKRFEIYIAGVELGNCYKEENDINQLRQRFSNQDEDFFQYMEFGMPQASGIAVGIDRLFMILTGKDKIC